MVGPTATAVAMHTQRGTSAERAEPATIAGSSSKASAAAAMADAAALATAVAMHRKGQAQEGQDEQ